MTPEEFHRLTKRTRNKYGAKATTLDGHRFSSKKECERYATLRLMERAGEIRDLKLQPRYPLMVNGQTVAFYIGDFEYIEAPHWELITEDVKSPATRKNPVYRLKAKFFQAMYGRKIRET